LSVSPAFNQPADEFDQGVDLLIVAVLHLDDVCSTTLTWLICREFLRDDLTQIVEESLVCCCPSANWRIC
jgi:hypothetical protein